jgi:hypothetical protein
VSSFFCKYLISILENNYKLICIFILIDFFLNILIGFNCSFEILENLFSYLDIKSIISFLFHIYLFKLIIKLFYFILQL